MADAITFRNALLHCGITQPEARDALVVQGYSNMIEFAALPEEEITYLVKAVNKMEPEAPGGQRLVIPFASIKKLQVMRKWMWEASWHGIVVVHNNFTPEELTRMLA